MLVRAQWRSGEPAGFGVAGVFVMFETGGTSRNGTVSPVVEVTTDEHGQAYVSLIEGATYRITVEYRDNRLERALTYMGEPVSLILLDPNTGKIVDLAFLTPQPIPPKTPNIKEGRSSSQRLAADSKSRASSRGED